MFSNNLFINFFRYIKMPKDASANYHQNNKERLQKKTCGRYQSLSKNEEKPQYG